MSDQMLTVGSALTGDTVDELLRGDWLKVINDDCWGRLELRNGQPVQVHAVEDCFIGVSGFRNGDPGWSCVRFAFLGRPNPEGWIENPGFNPLPDSEVEVRFRGETFLEAASEYGPRERWVWEDAALTHWRPYSGRRTPTPAPDHFGDITEMISDAAGLAWFERRFGVPLGDMPGRADVEAVRAAIAAGEGASS